MRRLSGRRVLWFAGLVFVIGLGIERAHTLAQAEPTDFDDAYMYLRYAKHVLAGQGVSWNVGEGNVYGVTSLLHLAVVSLVALLFPRLSAAGSLQVASGAAALAFLAGLVSLAVMARRERSSRPSSILGATAIVLLVACRETFVFHAGTGMDTMLSALANTAVALATVRLMQTPNPATAVWSALASVVAILARPDNAICAVLGPLLALLLVAKDPRRRTLLVLVPAMSVATGILLAATTTLLGSPLPLSFFAKQPGYYGDFAGEYGWNPYLFLKVFLSAAWPFIVATLVFAERASWRRLLVLLGPPLLTIFAFFRFNQIMGHLGRFYYPLLPFFVAAGVCEVDAWLVRHRLDDRLLGGGELKQVLWRFAASAALVLGASLGLSSAGAAYEERGNQRAFAPALQSAVSATMPLPQIDSWQAAHAMAAIAAAAPKGASFAMSEHGLPGALAPDARIIDVLGLHDSYVARHGFSADELFRRKPDVVWFPHPDHGAMLRDILDHEELWQHYAVFPDALFYGVALRRDSPAFSQLNALFRQQWVTLYRQAQPEAYRATRF